MSTVESSNQSSVVSYTFQQRPSHIASLRLRHAETKDNPEGKVPCSDAPTTSAKTPKTTSAPSPAPSTSAPAKETQKTDEISAESEPDPTEEALPSADTLPTDSSDSLPDVPFK